MGGVKPRRRLTIDDTGVLDADIPTVAELLTRMNTNHFKIDVSSTLININTDLAALKGPKGDTGKGWTDASYNSTSGVLTFNSTDGLGLVTTSIKGTNGTNGKGWTGATYSATTGKVSFVSNDGVS